MLKDTELKKFKQTDKTYKIADRGGMSAGALRRANHLLAPKLKSELKLQSYSLSVVGRNAISSTSLIPITEPDLLTRLWLSAAPFSTAILWGHLEN